MIQEPPEILPTDDMANPPDNLDPILCAHLLRKVDEQLIDLLNSLAPGEWELQTVAPSWKVRDVAAHLLDTAEGDRDLGEKILNLTALLAK